MSELHFYCRIIRLDGNSPLQALVLNKLCHTFCVNSTPFNQRKGKKKYSIYRSLSNCLMKVQIIPFDVSESPKYCVLIVSNGFYQQKKSIQYIAQSKSFTVVFIGICMM